MVLTCFRISRTLLQTSSSLVLSPSPLLQSNSLLRFSTNYSLLSPQHSPLCNQTNAPLLFPRSEPSIVGRWGMAGGGRFFSSSQMCLKKKDKQTKGASKQPSEPPKKKAPPKDISGYTPDKIRNFCIISHIDHVCSHIHLGKTSLSTRILEHTNTIETIEKFETKQDSVEHSLFLDKLEVEKERGITVKAMTASIFYEEPKTNEKYLLNLIDTPGHADFGYEVSRSMAACEGALLLVDASQGIQAQTMANYFLSMEQDLCIVPIVNKIDMQSARIEKTVEDMCSTFGVTEDQCLKVSAKSRIGIETIFPEILSSIPSPSQRGSPDAPLRALLFDSWFDTHQGVICLVRVIDGSLTKGQKVSSMFSLNEGLVKQYEVTEVGVLNPEMAETTSLHSGQVGYICMGMKDTREAQIGDTFCAVGDEDSVEALPGFQKQKPVVFAGIFPMEEGGFMHLGDCLAKLQLTDSSVVATKTLSPALGAGFHCGFLGLLHMDVFLERLNQEYDVEVMPTAPTVSFRVKVRGDDELVTVEIPSEFPPQDQIEECFEPFVSANIICPESYLGDVMSLCQSRRGELESRDVDGERVFLTYNIPLLEIITDFYDILKRITSGYASFTYENPVYLTSDLVRIDMLLNGEVVEPLVSIQHRSNVVKYGRMMAGKLKQTLKRGMFQIIIQATVGGKIVARETISAYRKDVTAKLYGGDVTRRMKLLNKQKEGKKRMKEFGKVGISQQDFYDILRK